MIAFESLATGWSWKTILAIIITCLTHLIGDLSAPVIAALATLIIVDWITGIVSSFKKGSSITSRKSYQGIVKIFIYFSICIMAYQTAEKINPMFLGWIDDMVYIYIAITEAISILENCQCFGKKHGVDLLFIGSLIKRLRLAEQKVSENSKEKKSDVETI